MPYKTHRRRSFRSADNGDNVISALKEGCSLCAEEVEHNCCYWKIIKEWKEFKHDKKY